MLKKCLALTPLILVAIGCNSGDVPIEQAKPAPNAQAANPTSDGAPQNQPQNTSQAISGNQNLPPAAKDALMGKGR